MRLRTLIIVIALAVVTAGIAAAPAAAKDPTASMLKQQLRHAKQRQQRSRERARAAATDLAGARQLHAATSVVAQSAAPGTAAGTLVLPLTMDQSLAATLMADGVVTRDEVAAQLKRATGAKRLARHWKVKVRRLKEKLDTLRQVAEWNGRGQWKPLMEVAAAKYGVSAAGLHRMMMLESGGQRTVGGMYKGLFQYYPSTWAGSWNPWRHESIYDGWAQIRATAYAVSRGMGPSQWPNTYPMAF